MFVTAGSDGVYALNVTNASDPRWLSHYNNSYIAHQITISDHYAYVAYDFGGLRILDVNNPRNITPVIFPVITPV